MNSKVYGKKPHILSKHLPGGTENKHKNLHQIVKSTIFWDITPFSPLKVNRRFGVTYHLHLQGRSISRARNQRKSRWQSLPYATKTTVDFQRITWRYIPENSTLHNHRCENLKFSIRLVGLRDETWTRYLPDPKQYCHPSGCDFRPFPSWETNHRSSGQGISPLL
jgi:hypothetical protein